MNLSDTAHDAGAGRRFLVAAAIAAGLCMAAPSARAAGIPCDDGRVYVPPPERPAPKRRSVTFGKVFGLDANGKALGTIEDETRAIFAMLRPVLAEKGLELNDLDDIQVFLADIAELPRFNAVLKEHVTGPLPLCIAFEGGNGFPPFNARIQMNGHAGRD